MKGFLFRLQAVLTLREQAETTAQLVHARACSAVAAAAARLRLADAAISIADDLHRKMLVEGSRAEELEQARAYAATLEERRIRAVRELREARQRADAARGELQEAMQRREALEGLRKRQRRRHDYEAARAEQKRLDELTSRGSVITERAAILQAAV